MGKPETSGGASTYIYGLIFVLYAGIAVVLFIYMMNKRYVSISQYVSIMKSARKLLTYCSFANSKPFPWIYCWQSLSNPKEGCQAQIVQQQQEVHPSTSLSRAGV